MTQMKPIEKRYRAKPRVEALTNELMEYQILKQQIGEVEARLEEYCSAIEDFGLACMPQQEQDNRVIYCRAQSYTPSQLLHQARRASDLLEKTAQEMEQARGRVLSKILSETENSAQYQAIRFACIDVHQYLATGQQVAEHISL